MHRQYISLLCIRRTKNQQVAGNHGYFRCSLQKSVPSLCHFLLMRAVYALIAVFLIVIIFFTQWYLCDVRGLCERIAILEILMMLLFAFLIGFAGSWLVSENIFLSIRHQVGKLLSDKSALTEQLQLKEKENQTARRHLAEWQQEASMLAQKRNLTEPLLTEAQTKVSTLKEELEQYQRRYDNLKHETDSIREITSQLKNELAAQKTEAEKLKAALEISKTEKKEETPDPHHSRFTPSSKQARNDLTLISGIGPVIQRKLNEIGIYTFQQLSELTPEMIDKITSTIKFFPDRIGRDNWIGQAAALMRMKK
jgi:predicted flap endonuclease-1-like 5' DNA nuclease